MERSTEHFMAGRFRGQFYYAGEARTDRAKPGGRKLGLILTTEITERTEAGHSRACADCGVACRKRAPHRFPSCMKIIRTLGSTVSLRLQS